MRIYSNYNDSDYEIILKEAEKLGFTPSSLQSYALMLFVMSNSENRKNRIIVALLQNKMLKELKIMKSNKSFMVSSFFPEEWPHLSRGDKMTLAKTLTNYVDKHSSEFIIVKKEPGQPKVYQKK
ncbi:MAG: DUF1413 domain-containing protein [Lachnospiraceae bacterium]|nr:DUF1413 domain-containing protein [Lachnospiraceae bacterium]